MIPVGYPLGWRANLRAVWILVSSLCAGCAAQPACHAAFAIDPAFTPDERAQVVSALDDWQSAIGVPFERAIGRAAPGVYQIQRGGATSGGCGEIDYDRETLAIEVREANECALLLGRTVRHEIGHALGLGHSTGSLSSVMRVDIADDADTVQPSDVAAWEGR